MKQAQVLLIGEGPSRSSRVSSARTVGFRITHRATLRQGMEALTKSEFDLIILNVSLPDASPTEAVTRTMHIAKHIPVIALLNENEAITDAQILDLGAHDCVLRGSDFDSVVRSVQYAFERRKLIAEKDRACRMMTQNRENLTSHLSHELRNALACIYQFGNILIDGLAGEISDEQREYLGIMLSNTSQIRQVLDRLLDVEPDSRNPSLGRKYQLLEVKD